MAENPQGLKIATPADADALLSFVMPIFAEDAAQPVSTARVEALIARCVNRDQAIAGVVWSERGAIEASVGAVIDRFDYTEDLHLMVRWLGVAPEFRRTDRAARMVGYVRWLFDTMQSLSDRPIPVFLPTLTTTLHQRKIRLYQRRAPQVGTLFAWGCLPDRQFVTTHAGKGAKGGGGVSKGMPVARAVRTD